MHIVSFLKEVEAELKKVIWPTKDEVVKMTILVIIASLVVGLYIGAIDLILTKIIGAFLK